ncbi:hypothetical protein Y013_25955 (plasmid) [Rhodococcus pyridinivorans SB3094]|uniref:TNase-like domain-containing protein n=1 Tax=Rhodococcus pyridinivorans SB3094 TaxID=1435356 RepID=V9XL26_9NOCA|nr:hypothetical protein [Rhodococcus pyridinivorans]AHD24156.1 hypothetical protein Y013_25955 [Rhodococcus pyridinivorans SB3094]WAL49217.1 hypothetical protein OQN32_26395 [Rhodococcus pyridinivorans]
MAKKNKWAVGATVIVVLAMFGSCNDGDSSSPSSTAARTTTVQVKDQEIWTGTVAAYPSSYSFSPEIHVDLGNGNIESVRLAHIGEPDCGNSSTSDQRRASLRGRVQQLLPLGARVTVVRGRELAGTDPRFTDEGFVFVEGAGTPTTTGPTSTSSSMSPSSTPTATSDPTGAPTSAVISTGAPSPPATSTANSEELLVNEVLLAEGHATPDDPEIDLSAAASKTLEQQLYSGSSGLELEPNISYFDRLLSAHRVAWDGSVGFMADCRAKEAKDLVDKQQREELDRIRRGPDGEVGTDDDDTRFWRYDEDGNLSIYTPSVGSGSGGGGGGGGYRCRGRWC